MSHLLRRTPPRTRARDCRTPVRQRPRRLPRLHLGISSDCARERNRPARASPRSPEAHPTFELIVVTGVLDLGQPGIARGLAAAGRAALGRQRGNVAGAPLACGVELGARCAPLRGRGARRSSRSKRRARPGDPAGAARAAPPRSADATAPQRLAPFDGRRVKPRMARSRRRVGWMPSCRTQRQRARPLLPSDPLTDTERRRG